MLEIIAVFMLSRKLGQVARQKGRPGIWGGLFAVGWIVGEVFGAIVGAIVSGGDVFVSYGVALAGAVAGGVAAWFIVKSLPLAAHFQPAYAAADPVAGLAPTPAAGGPAVAAPPEPAKRAGHSMECDRNVWLTGTGSCPQGHGPQSISNVYTVQE